MKRLRSRHFIWATTLGATMLGSALYIHHILHLLHAFRRLSAPAEFSILLRAAPTKTGHRSISLGRATTRTMLYVYLPMAGRGLRTINASRRQIEGFALHVWTHFVEQQQARATRLLVRVIALAEDEKECHLACSSKLLNSIVCLPMPSECRHPHYHIPTMGCIFRTIRAHAPQEVLVMYANSDLLFGPDLLEALSSLARSTSSEGGIRDFIIVGRRHEIEVPGPEWYVSGTLMQRVEESRRHAMQHGVLYSKYGMDYFVFSSPVLVPTDFPEFVLGRWRWDNALMAHYLLNDIPTVDASKTILAVHLGITPNNTRELYTSREGWQYNDALARAHYGDYFYLGHTDNARFVQTKTNNRYSLHRRDQEAFDSAFAAIDQFPYVKAVPTRLHGQT